MLYINATSLFFIAAVAVLIFLAIKKRPLSNNSQGKQKQNFFNAIYGRISALLNRIKSQTVAGKKGNRKKTAIILGIIFVVAIIVWVAPSKSSTSEDYYSGNTQNSSYSNLPASSDEYPAVPQNNNQQPAPNNQPCPKVQYIQDPSGGCIVRDILGHETYYSDFEVAINSVDPFTGFPIRSTNNAYLKQRVQRSKEMENVTKERDYAVQKYNECIKSGNKDEALEWERIARDRQATLHYRYDAPNFTGDIKVTGIDD